MQCQQCQSESLAGQRFCVSCGAALGNACGDCGFANAPENRFCGGCGLPLPHAGGAAFQEGAEDIGIPGAFEVRNETLPAWTYDDAEYFALEKELIFMRTWQLVCHASEVKEPGAYARLDLLGESALVIRGKDGVLRAFYNVCRHRASRLLDGDTGRCDRVIRCRYHGWVYDLDGSLKAVPSEGAFPGLDKAKHGLKPLQIEAWHGFVFVRFEGSGPGVAEMMAPYDAELSLYRLEEMQPIGGYTGREAPVDWKNAVDNNIEGYHIPPAHPGLQRLFGRNYRFETKPHGIARAGGRLAAAPSSNWSERHYQTLLPEVDHLPAERQRAWYYYSLFPNLAFDVYPDMVDFFQILPLAPGRSRSRARAYGLADSRRAMRAARYLNNRINTQVGREDVALVEGVQAGLASRSYDVGLLSDKEQRLREFHGLIRSMIPVAGCRARPAPGTLAHCNRRLGGRA